MKKTIAILALAIPLLGAAAMAQDGHAGHKHAAKTESTAPKAEKPKKAKAEKAVPRKVTPAEAGKEAVCPVTGEKVTVSTETASALYKGEIHYFCCSDCEKSFLAAPGKYAGKKAAPARMYVCPMGDYQGDKPGKCPKCGMTLVEKKPAAKKYVCPMGCAESSKPGRCPKCGMEMKERK